MRSMGAVIAFVFAALPAASPAATLTEDGAVRLSLAGNKDVQVSLLKREGDSLNTRLVQSQWLPAARVGANASYGFAGDGSAALSASLEGSQALPGGGTAAAGASRGVTVAVGDTVAYNGRLSLTLTQPLLAGAWRNAQTAYAVKVERLGHRQFTIQQRKDLAATLSRIRSLYWSYYERLRLQAISANALDYAQRQADRARTRYRIGEAAVLDTLSAVLELLTARQSHIDDQTAAAQARDELARALGVQADSLLMPESLAVSVPDLPPADTFIAAVEAYDPQLRLFEVLREKLTLQYQQGRNGLLPSLSAQARYEAPWDDLPLKENSVVSLVFSYAIPQMDRKVGLAQTALSIRENELGEKDYRVQLRNTLTQMIANWRREREKLALSLMSRDIAWQYFTASSKGYELGTVDRLNLLKAQNDFVSKSIKCVQQQIALKRLEISVDEITGNVFTKFGVQLQ